MVQDSAVPHTGVGGHARADVRVLDVAFAAQQCLLAIGGRNRLVQRRRHLGRKAVRCQRAELAVFIDRQVADRGTAQRVGLFQDPAKHRRRIVRRTIDDIQHFGQCRHLRQRRVTLRSLLVTLRLQRRVFALEFGDHRSRIRSLRLGIGRAGHIPPLAGPDRTAPVTSRVTG